MAIGSELPPSIQHLLNRGALRRIDDGEFVIDGLRHRQRSWMGWTTVIYELRIEEDDDGRAYYEIVEQTESLGDETVDCWQDPDDAACWIEQMLEEGV